MPRSAPPPQSTALAIPEDVLGDLLRDQANQVQTRQPLPVVRMLPAGVCQFEFMDTNETTREFVGVILGSHARNVLWERPYGDARPVDQQNDENTNTPACTATDGRYGTPRAGFAHAALQVQGQDPVIATGLERIVCATCPYNAWESAHMVGRQGRGKAVTNQRQLYIMVEGRQTPVELTLAPTSIPPFDEYLSSLFNRQTPTQAVLTKFRQERKSANRNGRTLQWAVATFSVEGNLTQEQFEVAVQKRREYLSYIAPSNAPQTTTVEARMASDDETDAPVPF